MSLFILYFTQEVSRAGRGDKNLETPLFNSPL